MTSILSVSHLSKTYPGQPPVHAVDGISFDLIEGKILGIVGPNGSGKTTTMQMLLGTLTPTSGDIKYFGKDFARNRSEALQHISFASTYTSLPWLLTVKENLDVFGFLYGMKRSESAASYEPLLKRFGISEKKNSAVASLSAGQITRLMLVKAFFIKPKIVLLDEPTASLDPDISQDICSFLLEHRDQYGTSILFSSHKMDEVMELCDQAIFLKTGKIIANDSPKALAKSLSGFRVRFIIIDGMKRALNIIDKEKLQAHVDHKTIEITIEEHRIPTLLNALAEAKVVYANIKIEEPTLEDFFLHMAR